MSCTGSSVRKSVLQVRASQGAGATPYLLVQRATATQRGACLVVATKYEVLVEHKSAAQARELLAGLPGGLPDPFA